MRLSFLRLFGKATSRKPHIVRHASCCETPILHNIMFAASETRISPSSRISCVRGMPQNSKLSSSIWAFSKQQPTRGNPFLWFPLGQLPYGSPCLVANRSLQANPSRLKESRIWVPKGWFPPAPPKKPAPPISLFKSLDCPLEKNNTQCFQFPV